MQTPENHLQDAMKPGELAQTLGVSERTIHHWRTREVLLPTSVGKQFRFPVDEQLIAAVLAEIEPFGVQVPYLKQIATALRCAMGKTMTPPSGGWSVDDIWLPRAVRAARNDEPAWLVVSIGNHLRPVRDDDPAGTAVLKLDVEMEGRSIEADKSDLLAYVRFDLRGIFRRVLDK